MKKYAHKSGFTLVELLVVIAIIAALATASVAAFSGASRGAKKKQSEAIAYALESAIEQYHIKYGSFPPPVEKAATAWAGESIPLDTTSADAQVLCEELTGKNANINYRAVDFLPLQNAKQNKNGFTYSGVDFSGIVDGFGNPLYILFDYDYDGSITVPTGYTNEGTAIRAKVLVYSPGLDLTPGNADDVYTWKSL